MPEDKRVTVEKVEGGFLLEQHDPVTFERKVTVAKDANDVLEKVGGIIDARPKNEKLLPSQDIPGFPIDIGDS